MTPPHQCEFASAVSEAERCKNQATVMWGGAWFCNEHAGGRAKLLEAPRDARMQVSMSAKEWEAALHEHLKICRKCRMKSPVHLCSIGKTIAGILGEALKKKEGA